MAHNPSRPKGLDPAATQRIAEEIARRPRKWSDLAELADWIEQRARIGKRVVLLPETALIVSYALRRKENSGDGN